MVTQKYFDTIFLCSWGPVSVSVHTLLQNCPNISFLFVQILPQSTFPIFFKKQFDLTIFLWIPMDLCKSNSFRLFDRVILVLSTNQQWTNFEEFSLIQKIQSSRVVRYLVADQLYNNRCMCAFSHFSYEQMINQ